MKYASGYVLTFAFLTPAIFAACASGDDASMGFGGNHAGTSTTGNGGSTATTSNTGTGGAGGATGCVTQCFSDLDCANSCPATAGGANCCDKQTGVCYVAGSATCPVAPDGGGGTPMPY